MIAWIVVAAFTLDRRSVRKRRDKRLAMTVSHVTVQLRTKSSPLCSVFLRS